MGKLNVLPEKPREETPSIGRFPSFLHRKLPRGSELPKTNHILRKYRLNTVCEEAKCPNRLECYSKKTATFLALGNHCTRSCGFCDIGFSKKPPCPDSTEPNRIALSVKELGLRHVVITMVARDDLEDGGAEHIGQIIDQVRDHSPYCTVEVLTSDLEGRKASLDLVLKRRPEIFNHNIETVRTYTPRVRHKATYDRSLEVLSYVKSQNKSQFVKSGIMVGFGESEEEVKQTIRDLHQAGCDIVTIGQYLQASKNRLRVKEFVTPEQYSRYADFGHQIGIKYMYCGPFVRSSYNAQSVKSIAEERS